ncbi:hypothetical protein TRICI_003210 [Trichomonascus ciferrii]|uniref:Uncharacterized protein n=1 Tax=Trichomonascus ciferrii TaxID=44093 RepID=A0A642V4M4_9ASCO|nr:hypothetical protein TRICI_003210 [Trichomonascus ciferrii]
MSATTLEGDRNPEDTATSDSLGQQTTVRDMSQHGYETHLLLLLLFHIDSDSLHFSEGLKEQITRAFEKRGDTSSEARDTNYDDVETVDAALEEQEIFFWTLHD